MKNLLLFILIIASSSPLHAQIISAQNGNWQDPATWVGAVVPTEYDAVIINHEVNSFESSIKANVTINSTGILNLYVNPSIQNATIINEGVLTGGSVFDSCIFIQQNNPNALYSNNSVFFSTNSTFHFNSGTLYSDLIQSENDTINFDGLNDLNTGNLVLTNTCFNVLNINGSNPFGGINILFQGDSLIESTIADTVSYLFSFTATGNGTLNISGNSGKFGASSINVYDQFEIHIENDASLVCSSLDIYDSSAVYVNHSLLECWATTFYNYGVFEATDTSTISISTSTCNNYGDLNILSGTYCQLPMSGGVQNFGTIFCDGPSKMYFGPENFNNNGIITISNGGYIDCMTGFPVSGPNPPDFHNDSIIYLSDDALFEVTSIENTGLITGYGQRSHINIVAECINDTTGVIDGILTVCDYSPTGNQIMDEEYGYIDTATVWGCYNAALSEVVKLTGEVFPNPVSNQINIQLDQHVDAGVVYLLSLDGKIVLQERVKETNYLLVDMSCLSPGSYVLYIQTSSGSLRQIIVKV